MALSRKLVNALRAGNYEPSAASKRAREAAARINAERRAERTPVEIAHDVVNPPPPSPGEFAGWGREIDQLRYDYVRMMRERFQFNDDGSDNVDFDEFTVAAQAQSMTKAQLKRALNISRDDMIADIKSKHAANQHSFFFYHNNVSYEW
jgi:hypothetical protein